ncbi:MAG: helix-turn-helix domain-containing protein [Thermodesulfobacteriota bacterium]
MNNKIFIFIRHNLQKTQKQMAELLGISLKAVQSFEQGWRNVPVHVERQMLFLWTMKRKGKEAPHACWEIRQCPSRQRQHCPAWEFQCGHLCWFINGTICQGKPMPTWAKKIRVCQKCSVFKEILGF